MKTLLALLILGSPAMAGEQWGCDADLPWYIERIPHGFAIVRIYRADYCRDDGQKLFICENRDDYRLGFEDKGDTLTLTYANGEKDVFQKCPD
jgi:hypothetical protein